MGVGGGRWEGLCVGGYVEWEGEGGKEEVCALADIESDFARETQAAAAEKEVEWGEQRRDDGARFTFGGDRKNRHVPVLLHSC